MSVLRNLLIVGFLCSLSIEVWSQGLYYTDPIIICDIRDINNVPQSLPDPSTYDDSILEEIPNCESTFRFELNNPKWYQFVATSTNASLTINIDASSCVNSNTPSSTGIQYALVEVVDGEVIPVFCDSEANRSRAVSLMASDLVPGKTYYLVLDGFASSICDFSIWNISGLGLADITQTISEIRINDVNQTSSCRIGGVIKLEAVNIAGGPVQNAAEYTWHLEDRDNPGNFTLDTVTLTSVLELTGLLSSIYSVTVQASNACAVSNSLPEEITILISPQELLTGDALCLSDISRGYMPTDPTYEGPTLFALPNNPTRDTFFVEKMGIDGCPIMQLIPVDIAAAQRGILDTAYCGSQAFIFQGERYLPRPEPYFVDYNGGGGGGACDSIIELTVTQFFFQGSIMADQCGGLPTLSVESLLSVPFNFEDFAQYSWRNANGDEVGTDPILNVPRTGEYTLVLDLVNGENRCSFTVDPQFASATGSAELDPRCTSTTNSSVTVAWNQIDNASYIIAVDGQTIGSQTENSYTQSDLTDGQAVTIDIFAVIAGSDCPPINENARCRATACEEVLIVIDPMTASVCLAEGVMINPMELSVTRTGGNGVGTGAWTISTGGVLETPLDQNTVMFDPMRNGEGSYTITYTYTEGECEYSERTTIEVVQPPISTILNFSDETCLTLPLELNYNGNAGTNAVAVWGGDANDATIVGEMPGPFTMLWSAPGTKNFTFMIRDGDCISETTDYSVDVGASLSAPMLACNATSQGLQVSWNEQACVGNYEVIVNGQMVDVTTGNQYLITGLTIGASIDVMVNAINSCGCADASSAVLVGCIFEDCPDVEVDVTSATTMVCIDPENIITLQLEEVITNGNLAIGVGTWSGQGVDQSGTFFPILSGIGEHTIRYDWVEGGCSFSDSIQITVQQSSSFNVTVTHPCINDEFGSIQIFGGNVVPDINVIIDGVDVGPGLIHDVSSGIHEIVIIDNNSSCVYQLTDTVDSAPINVDIFQPEGYFVNQGQNLDFDIDSILIPLIDEIIWTYDGVPICMELECGYMPEVSGELCVNIAYDSVCDIYQECTMIEYLPTFKRYQPNVISMSEEGSNNTFRIFTNDPRAIVSELLIYDRWGNKIYENMAVDADNTWNPSLDPSRYNPGVFVYHAIVRKGDGEVLELKGTVTVIK